MFMFLFRVNANLEYEYHQTHRIFSCYQSFIDFVTQLVAVAIVYIGRQHSAVRAAFHLEH